MPSYLIVNFTPKNLEKLKIYSACVNETLAEYSGEFLVKGPTEVLSGCQNFTMQLIMLFPTREAVLGWYYSPEYQALTTIRDESMTSQFQIVG